MFGILSMPFLILRCVYGLLTQFNSESPFSTWNPLFGSVAAFAVMAVLPEFIIVGFHIWLGFYRIRNLSKLEMDTDGKPARGNAGV
jgi:hypothetical protein